MARPRSTPDADADPNEGLTPADEGYRDAGQIFADEQNANQPAPAEEPAGE